MAAFVQSRSIIVMAKMTGMILGKMMAWLTTRQRLSWPMMSLPSSGVANGVCRLSRNGRNWNRTVIGNGVAIIRDKARAVGSFSRPRLMPIRGKSYTNLIRLQQRLVILWPMMHTSFCRRSVFTRRQQKVVIGQVRFGCIVRVVPEACFWIA